MPSKALAASAFSTKLVAWHRRHGRKGLPWQGTRDPYRIWLSEIMLQQTQVAAVIPYYLRFLARFPSLSALAAADEEAVLQLWSGLGYYARGRNLHLAAREIASVHKGKFPATAQAIVELPGVGRSTAAAIAAFAFGERAAILDGNVKRVLSRYYGIEGWPGERAVEMRLWELAEKLLPKTHIGIYTQALMDLGATLCTRAQPRCEACPMQPGCMARKTGRIDSIPAPRPKKVLPQKRATWLLLLHRSNVLLEKRPPSGLWGGLWTLPEFERRSVKTSVEAYCRTAFGCEVAAPRELALLSHGFTHFHLSIRPVRCDVTAMASRAEGAGRKWTSIAEARDGAVPTPVRKLLCRLG